MRAMLEIMSRAVTSLTCLSTHAKYAETFLGQKPNSTTTLPGVTRSYTYSYVGDITNLAIINSLSAGGEEALKSHVKKDEISNLYFCDICRQFSNRGAANVRNHVEAKHLPNMFTYSCEICHMTFGKKTALYNHRKNTHRKLEIMNVDSTVSWK